LPMADFCSFVPSKTPRVLISNKSKPASIIHQDIPKFKSTKL
jgi:hypothetical protein